MENAKLNVKEIDYKDRSEFLRGLSVIIRKNNCRNIDGTTMFLTIGKYLGFEKGFCEKSLEHLMVNKYISEKPPVFSNEFIAESIIDEVTKIMSQTHPMSGTTVELLQLAANVNKVNFVI